MPSNEPMILLIDHFDMVGISRAHEHWIMHHLSRIIAAKLAADCLIALTQLIFIVLQMGPSSVQVQLLQGLILLVAPKSMRTFFCLSTRQVLVFSLQWLKSIEGRLEQCTLAFLYNYLNIDYPIVIIDIK